MAEGLIVRKGGGGSGKTELRTEVIMTNTNWKVPDGIKNNSISVRIFGGGGSAYYRTYGGSSYPAIIAGSGSGWMNNAVINVIPGQIIPVSLGEGGHVNINALNTSGTSGGSSFFGSYLSANGGEKPNGWSGGNGGAGGGGTDSSSNISATGGTGYQFGGGGGGYGGNDLTAGRGGNGGIWGGGGGGGGVYDNTACSNGGDGGYYGGGGGAGAGADSYGYGGNGGYYGGGGGGGAGTGRYWNSRTFSGYGGRGGWWNNNGTWEQSGFGGNGGAGSWRNTSNSNYTGNQAENGTNTLGWTNIYFDEHDNCYYNGAGLGGVQIINNNKIYTYGGGGGGGFGGNGGKGIESVVNNNYVFHRARLASSGAGGGGYASNGGNGGYTNAWYYDRGDGTLYRSYSLGGAGGGGFGGDGGDCDIPLNYTDNQWVYCGAGGGGYGKAAKGGSPHGRYSSTSYPNQFHRGGGGGGYHAPGYSNGAAGGCGLMGMIGGKYPAQGSGDENDGGPGICIIQYLI